MRNDDYRFLNIRILATDGSDGIEPVGEDLQKLAGKLVSKMTGKQITLGVILYLLLFFSSPIAQKWIDGQYEAKKHEGDSHERLAQSEIDLHRLQLVTTALEQNPHFKPLQDAAEDGKEALVRSVVDVPRSRILGAAITSDEAKVVVSNPKSKGLGRRLDAIYRVTEIDNESEDGYIGLFNALEQKTNVNVLVNVYVIDGKISSATIMRANPSDDGSGD